MKLTAGQLIEELKLVSPDTEIHFTIQDGCCGDYMDLEVSGTDIESNYGDRCQILFTALKGFTSCIKSGRTKKFIDSLYKENK